MVLYLDPGAGSMLIQALLAGALAIPFFFRSAISRTVDRVRAHTSGRAGATEPREE